MKRRGRGNSLLPRVRPRSVNYTDVSLADPPGRADSCGDRGTSKNALGNGARTLRDGARPVATTPIERNAIYRRAANLGMVTHRNQARAHYSMNMHGRILRSPS